MAVVVRAVSRLWAPIEAKLPQTTQTYLNHPAGPKTIHFWAPTFKWGLVLAGLADALTRPADKLSFTQSSALAATGLIWSRYSLVINPVNYNLFGVNILVFCVGSNQLYRIWKDDQQKKKAAAAKT